MILLIFWWILWWRMFWDTSAGPISVYPLSPVCCSWFVGHVWASEIKPERECAKDFYPLVVSLGKGLSYSFRGKKIQMSNYPCSAVHGGSDPVGKISFISLNFIFYSPATLIQLAESERVMLHKYVEVFVYGVPNHPVWCHPPTLQVPAE